MPTSGRGPDPTAAVAAAATEAAKKTSLESGDDSEEESEILEESPCGRWLKRREVVEQRDVPGIDCAYLAMDTEEGVEVVWNEVQFSERKNYKAQEDKIRQVFESLTQLQHANIVNFHRYWTDTHNDKPRVIFITEYMSSGSLKQFLKRTKRNVKKISLIAWKRWCTQILSALSYLHSCSPPIIHGNLTCDTIFIQHNGLVKIGSVAPDTIHVHIKTCRENMKNMHFIAPECGNYVTPAIDVYAFGMCALEMASLEIQGNGDSGTLVTQDHINRTIESLDDPLQKDLIYQCLTADFEKRPTARTLLFHPVLFEVHALKLLAAHALVKTEHFADRLSDEMYPPEKTMAEILHAEDETRTVQMKMSDVPESNKLEKFVEDVRFGIYPLTAYALEAGPVRLTTYQPQSPTGSMDQSAPSDRSSAGPIDVEVRRIVNTMCNIKPRDDAQNDFTMTILLRMDDKMNRQLTCSITDADTASSLSQELVHFGFINEADRDKIYLIIDETLSEGPQYKEDDPSSVLVDHGISPSKVQKPSSMNTVNCSAAPSSLRPSVIRSPIKRDGS